MGEFVLIQRLGEYLDAVTRCCRGQVTAGPDDGRVAEVLVQVVHPLDDAVVEGCADGDVVEHGQVLHVLAQADAAGVRAYGNAELRGEQQDREHLVDSAEPARVYLADVDGAGLEELLEDDAILHVLAGRDPDRGDLPPDPRVPQDVVRIRTGETGPEAI